MAVSFWVAAAALAAPAPRALRGLDMYGAVQDQPDTWGELDLSHTYPFERSFGAVVWQYAMPSRPKAEWIELCGKLHTDSSRGSGAAYTWCDKAVTVPRLRGYSYGVHNWDTWSRYLSDQHGVESYLYDCYKTPTYGTAKEIPQYATPYTRFDVCVAKQPMVDEKGRKFELISDHLGPRDPLSTMVKIDIEGTEWEVIESMTDADLSKIVQLDFEIHFCVRVMWDGQVLPKQWTRVAEQLDRLDRFFEVVDRMYEGLVPGSSCQNRSISCRKMLPPAVPGTTMMSISYINREFVKNGLRPHAGGGRDLPARWMKGADVSAMDEPHRVAEDEETEAGGASVAGSQSSSSVDAHPVSRGGAIPKNSGHLKIITRSTMLLLADAPKKRRALFAFALERLTRPSLFISDNRCGGIDTAASRGAGAGYFWCKNVLRSTPNPVGLSYGIFTWDTWSKYMANTWKVKTKLYDCFSKGDTDHSRIPQYDVPYERFPVCLGERPAGLGGAVYEDFYTHVKDLKPLSVFAKIDIEGDEYKVLEAISSEDLAKVALLDLEIHWCLKGQTDSLNTIVMTLKRLLKQFDVVGRIVEGDWIHGVGCGRSPLQTSMLSISYVNKAALLGQVVKENTTPNSQVSAHPTKCNGKTAVATANGVFSWCDRVVQTASRSAGASIISVGDDDRATGNWSTVVGQLGFTHVEIPCTPAGRSASSAGCAGADRSSIEQVATRLREQLVPRPSSALNMPIVQLNLDGYEWRVLTMLLDSDSIGHIGMLDIHVNICTVAAKFQMIDSVLKRLLDTFMVSSRDDRFTREHHPGCLEGQIGQFSVSFVNKKRFFVGDMDPDTDPAVKAEFFAVKGEQVLTREKGKRAPLTDEE